MFNYLSLCLFVRLSGWRRDLKREGFRRSESNPGYFWTDSQRRWIRDDSRFGKKSGERSGSRPRSEEGKRLEALEKRLEKEGRERKEALEKMN